MDYSSLGKFLSWFVPIKNIRRTIRKYFNEKQIKVNNSIIWENYKLTLHNLQIKYKNNKKLKVVFLNSENSKWVYQSLYEEFEKLPNFEVQVLVTAKKMILNSKYSCCNWQDDIKKSYNFFKVRNMNVQYAFDLKNKEFLDLQLFKPDIIFYEQPWELSNKQSPLKTSKFALCFYCPYGSCITSGSNEYSEPLYHDVFRYFVDNDYIQRILEEHGCRNDALVVAGQLKLDAYQKQINFHNIHWQSKDKKHVIYAPHHSFYKDSLLGFGTFDWNYKFFYNLVKEHQEIEFILKPHPELKKQILNQGLMSEKEMQEYFKAWVELPNAQIYEEGDYFDMFRTSDLLITDCNSFLYEYLPTYKPVIHLISKNSVGHNEFGQKITAGYYSARDIDEIKKYFKQILFQEQDLLFEVRRQIVEKDLMFLKKDVAKFVINYIAKTLKEENCNDM